MKILALHVSVPFVQAAILEGASAAPLRPIARMEYEVDHAAPGAAEVPSDRLWTAVTAAARQATRGVEGVEAIGLATAPSILVLLDRADRPLAPFWTSLDQRARPAARQTWAAVGLEFLRTTGNRPLPGLITVVQFRQQLEEDPYLAHRVGSYLHLGGWLGLRLTGERAFDRANASFSGLYGTLTDQAWSPRWADYFEVEPAWLPPVRSGDATLGSLRSAVAAELGVPAGLPVKLGTTDLASALLAAGMRPGDLLHFVGVTQFLATLTDHPVADVRRLTFQHGVGATFVHATHNPVGAAALDWLRRLCFPDVSASAFQDEIVPTVLKRATRVTLDPPHLAGDPLELEAHWGAFRDLTLATDRLDLLAAVLEAMRRHHERALAALGLGDRVPHVFWTGDGAEVVRRLLPEYQGATVQRLDEAPLRGVARLFG
jgi:xylulokinase